MIEEETVELKRETIDCELFPVNPEFESWWAEYCRNRTVNSEQKTFAQLAFEAGEMANMDRVSDLVKAAATLIVKSSRGEDCL